MERVERSFADLEYESKKHKTRRERFLERMEVLVPWERLLEEIRPYYPKAGRGRAPYELESMLRVHCVQLFYNLSGTYILVGPTYLFQLRFRLDPL